MKIEIVSILPDKTETYNYLTGNIIRRGNSIYLRYNHEGTDTTLKYNNGRLLLIRTGDINQRQEFRSEQTTTGEFGSSGLLLTVSAFTQKIQYLATQTGFEIELCYQLSINEMPQGLHQLMIKVKEEV